MIAEFSIINYGTHHIVFLNFGDKPELQHKHFENSSTFKSTMPVAGRWVMEKQKLETMQGARHLAGAFLRVLSTVCLFMHILMLLPLT